MIISRPETKALVDGVPASSTPNPNTIPISDTNGKLTGWDIDRVDGFDASQSPIANQIPVLSANGQLQLPFHQTPILVDGQNLMKRTFYVDADNGDDNNPGTSDAPFKTLRKAIDSVPMGGIGDIRIKGDYILDEVILIVNKKIQMSLHGNLQINWITDDSNYDRLSGRFSLQFNAAVVFYISPICHIFSVDVSQLF